MADGSFPRESVRLAAIIPMMADLIYLDNNATTRPLAEVVEGMLPCLREAYANPSSVHKFGQSVRHQMECARERVATLIGARLREIVFTSGGTEAINLAIRGALRTKPNKRRFVTSAVEHSAVLRVADRLKAEGYDVVFVGVDRQGRVDEDAWRAALTDDTALASIMHANNETGVIQDVATLAGIAEERGVPVHLDAVQSVGKVRVSVAELPVAFLSLSAHKFHGPKGIGALYIRRRERIDPLILGGSQERNLRGGTENIPGIIGMMIAAQVILDDDGRSIETVRRLRDRLEAGILAAVPFAHVNGAGAERIANTSNISFEGLEAEAILILLSEAGICASSGSACSSGSLEPSHVLKAMGIEESIAHGAIRFSLSKFTTEGEVDQVVSALPKLLSRLTVLSAR